MRLREDYDNDGIRAAHCMLEVQATFKALSELTGGVQSGEKARPGDVKAGRSEGGGKE